MENKYDRYLAEDEIGQYVHEESPADQFEKIYNTFVESDLVSFKAQLSELNTNDFAKFMVHLIEMNVHPKEITRTLNSIID